MPTSINLPFDRFGPPGTAGEIVILEEHTGESQDVERARLHDAEARDFQVAALLQKSALHDFDIKLLVDHERGGSYLVAPKDAVVSHIDTPDGRLVVRHNTKREFAKIELTCIASSGDDALAIFHAVVASLLDHLSYVAKVPVHLARTEWVDLKNGVRGYNHTNPYVPMIPAGNNLMQLQVKPLYALYREAKNAASPFYRFLCFYKILEGTQKIVRPKFFERAKARGVKPITIKEVVPDDARLTIELEQAEPLESRGGGVNSTISYCCPLNGG